MAVEFNSCFSLAKLLHQNLITTKCISIPQHQILVSLIRLQISNAFTFKGPSSFTLCSPNKDMNRKTQMSPECFFMGWFQVQQRFILSWLVFWWLISAYLLQWCIIRVIGCNCVYSCAVVAFGCIAVRLLCHRLTCICCVWLWVWVVISNCVLHLRLCILL